PARGCPLIYSLAQSGADLQRDRQPELTLPETIDWAEKNRGLSDRYLHHALMVADFRTALTVALRAAPSTTLDHFEREGRDLKAEWRTAGRRLYVHPDAFFILRDTTRPAPRQRAAFFLEADRSTMPL